MQLMYTIQYKPGCGWSYAAREWRTKMRIAGYAVHLSHTRPLCAEVYAP